jgi:allophanate hydrolase
MAVSLDFHTLRRAYASGAATPASIVRQVISQMKRRGDDGVWISRVPDHLLLEEAAALEGRAAAAGTADLPLYGLPFAVKDNIDVAGLPTTAACPEFAYIPAVSAPVVDRLRDAGALCVGKTNLDQFATGLVGVRSPYGVPRNPFDPAYIPGGSSSGSAVAVAAGLASFALGTDTAGSGRVPAAFNNIVGLKPTRGLLSTRGVVPACHSLDCVSILALTVADAAVVLDCALGFDAQDPYARPAPAGFGAYAARPARFGVGVPRPDQLEFFGNSQAARLFDAAIARLAALGGEIIEVDFAPFTEVAALVYGGPWLAERRAAVEAAIAGRREILHAVTRQVIAGGDGMSAAAVFHGQERLALLKQQIAPLWRRIDLMLVPTAGTIYRIAEINADPLALNSTLGHYTNFANLLDLSAIALPSGFQPNGLPAGVSLLAPAFHEPLLAAVGAAFQRQGGLPLGATGAALPPLDAAPPAVCYPYLPIAVVGAHLSGQPLNGELRAIDARLRRVARTAPDYRLYVLADGRRPGLVRDPAAGTAIEAEIWDVPVAAIGALLAGIEPPLGLGTIALEDGGTASGFLCEAYAVEGAREISEFGGWRAWRSSSVAKPPPPAI